MKGRKPKPTALKVITGNPGKRAINDQEPQPTAGAPKCPAWLDAEAKAKWKALVPELERLGLLTVVDGDTLSSYCQAWSEFRQATETLQKHGRYVRTGGVPKDPAKPAGEWIGGQLQSHPAVAQQRSAWKAIQTFGALFGMDPSSRSRLKVGKKEEVRDPFEEFLQGTG